MSRRAALAVASLATLLHSSAWTSLAGEPDECPHGQCPREDESALLQSHARQGSVRKEENVLSRTRLSSLLPAEGQEFKEPPVIRSPVRLTLTTMKICGLQNGQECWHTRVYAAEGVPPSLPGPTIRVKPGETLKVHLINALENPSPDCWTTLVNRTGLEGIFDTVMSSNGFCHLNSTNLHTHGLHTSPLPGGDDVFQVVEPGKENNFTFELPSYHMPGTFWYHPHRHHTTAIQAGGGAHGAIIVEDPPGSIPPELENMEEKLMVLSLVDLRYFIHPSTGVFGQSSMEKYAMGNLWKNDQGEYVNKIEVVVLVNGLYKPEMTIKSGKWYRLCIIFASTELTVAIHDAFHQKAECEYRLLAKDGIYLNVAPRDIKKIYLASGNRADVAFRCACEPTTLRFCEAQLISNSHQPGPNSSWAEGLENATEGPFSGISQEVLNQVLLKLKIETGAPKEPALRSFKVNRPCYLVDLRQTTVKKSNQGRLEFMNPTDWYIRWSNKISGGIAHGRPMRVEDETPPLTFMKVGEVQQWYVRGPEGEENKVAGVSEHPFHLHVNPYQLVSLSPPTDPFFQVGDWQDTFLHSTGQAMVKTQLDAFTGRSILHCHLLDHEDMGMMAWFKIYGEEGSWWRGARDVDPRCYRDQRGMGYEYVDPNATMVQVAPSWVKADPESNCHAACTDLGGCTGEFPESKTAFASILQELGEKCEITDAVADCAPCVDMNTNSCYISAKKEAMRRCAVEPPEGFSRFCHCAGI